MDGRGFIVTAERLEKRRLGGPDWTWWKRKTYIPML
jgi:hypothetical protein